MDRSLDHEGPEVKWPPTYPTGHFLPVTGDPLDNDWPGHDFDLFGHFVEVAPEVAIRDWQKALQQNRMEVDMAAPIENYWEITESPYQRAYRQRMLSYPTSPTLTERLDRVLEGK